MHFDCDLEALETQTAEEVIGLVLTQQPQARVCITCSFQAQGVVVLHLLRRWIPDVPVLFLDTGYHFPQTYEFRDQLTRDWNLNLVNLTPVQSVQQQESELGILYDVDPTKCCQLRKVEPLLEALEPFDI